MSYRPRFNWGHLRPGRPMPAPPAETMTVTLVVECLLKDPAWDDLHGTEPRHNTARHLLAVRWAVLHGWISEGNR